jgi:GH25 family lysozyme M1 (1,4-beta-N-acetylmuramidase)
VKTLGCDVSHWEEVIDWKVASKWVPFAYFKCTDGTGLFDNTYLPNKHGCQAAGMPFAPYHYYEPADDPEVQALAFVQKAGDHAGKYIADFEEPGTALADKYHRFLIKMEQLTGRKPAIYTSAGFWNEHVLPHPTWAHEYDLLVAHYTSEHSPILPIGWDHYVIWQYTDAFYFPGCTCAADGDWFNGSLEQMRSWFGNYHPQEDSLPAVPFQLKSLFDGLHVRRQPRISAHEVSHLAKGEVVDLIDLAGMDVWIRHAGGYTAVEINGYRFMEVVK